MQTILPETNPFQNSSEGDFQSPPTTQKSKPSGFKIELLYGVLLFLLPFFFLPITADMFDLNKAYFVMVMSLVILLAFFISGVKNKSLEIKELKAYLGISLFAIAAILATFMTVNKQLSLFGGFGTYTNSFLFFAALVILGFVATNIKLSLNKLLTFFAWGVTIATTFALLVYYGVPLSLPGVGQVGRFFTMSGSTSILFGLEVIAVLTGLYLLPKASDTKNTKQMVSFSLIVIINLVYLLVGLNLYALAILVLGIIVMHFVGNINLAKHITIVMPIILAVAVLAFISYFPSTRTALNVPDYVQAPRLGVQESWYVSASTARDVPLGGAGIGTFYMGYSQYRPATMNYTDAWGLRFSQPFNDIFTWLTIGGLVGLVLFAGFWFVTIRDAIKLRKEKSDQFLAPFIFIMSALVLLLLGFNPILYVLLFSVIGIIAARVGYNKAVVPFKGLLQIFSLLTLVLIIGLVYQAYPVYAGQYKFLKSATDNLVDRYNLQREAINSDPYESVYRRENISTGLLIAQRISSSEEPAEADIAVARTAVEQAILDSRILTELVNPQDVANWETRGGAYNFLVGSVENAEQFAITAYSNAIQLEPTNPKLWINIGAIYYRMEAYQNAVQAFARAVELKNDYALAHYSLAYALKDAGDISGAVVQLEITLRLVPEGSTDHEKVSEELVAFKELEEQYLEQVAAQQAEAAERQKALQVDEGEPGEIVDQIQEPLARPEEIGDYQLESNEDLQIDEGVLEPGEPGAQGDEQTEGDEFEIPVADGNEVDEDQGETDAPLAEPPVE